MSITGSADGTWTGGGTSGMLQRASGGSTAPALEPAVSVSRTPFDGRDADDNAADLASTNPTPKARNAH